MTDPNPKPITATTLPKPAWSHEWVDTRPGMQTQNHQGLYPITTREGLSVGVRVTLVLDLSTTGNRSYAAAEVFDGAMWNPVASLPAVLMKLRSGTAGYVRWDESGAQHDVATLLEDVRLAYQLRTMGSNELGMRDRVMVTHDSSSRIDRFNERMRATMKRRWETAAAAAAQDPDLQVPTEQEVVETYAKADSKLTNDERSILHKRALLDNIGPAGGDR